MKYCIVYGCDSFYKDNVSLFSFPTDDTRRARWIEYVRRRCPAWVGPNSVQCVCSSHFAANDFINRGQCDMNLCKKLVLTKTAVPSDVVPISTTSINFVHVIMTDSSTQCNFYAEQLYERSRTVSCQTTFSYGKCV
jgi:THAP domain